MVWAYFKTQDREDHMKFRLITLMLTLSVLSLNQIANASCTNCCRGQEIVAGIDEISSFPIIPGMPLRDYGYVSVILSNPNGLRGLNGAEAIVWDAGGSFPAGSGMSHTTGANFLINTPGVYLARYIVEYNSGTSLASFELRLNGAVIDQRTVPVNSGMMFVGEIVFTVTSPSTLTVTNGTADNINIGGCNVCFSQAASLFVQKLSN